MLVCYAWPMPRGENLDKVRGTREELARRLGQEPLGPGEATRLVHIRGEKEVLDLFAALPAKERGRVIRAGLEALGLMEGED